jgi:hypothetical protein
LTVDKLYRKLRALISGKYKIAITDKEGYNNKANVCISPCNGNFPWVCFQHETIEKALQDAINKFQYPEKDYTDPTDNHVWKANEESVYEESHIRLFLKEASA